MKAVMIFFSIRERLVKMIFGALLIFILTVSLFSPLSVQASVPAPKTSSGVPTTSSTAPASGEVVNQTNAHLFGTPIYQTPLYQGELLKKVWRIVLSITNLAIFFFLLAIGFGTIFHLQIETYHIKKAISPLIIGIILANFSFMITHAILDFNNIATVSLVNMSVSQDSQHPLVEFNHKLSNSVISFQIIADLIKTGNWKSGLVGLGAGAGTVAYGMAAGAGGTVAAGIILLLLLLLVMIFLAAVVFLILAILFYVRIAMLFILVALSPAAFLCIAWAPVQSFFKRWWHQFLIWAFMPTISFFFFWLVIQISQLFGASEGGFNLWRYIIVLVLFVLGAVAPFKLGGAVGAMVGGGIKKSGRWLGRSAWLGGNRLLESRSIVSPRAALEGWKRGRERVEREKLEPMIAKGQSGAEKWWLRAHKLRRGSLHEQGTRNQQFIKSLDESKGRFTGITPDRFNQMLSDQNESRYLPGAALALAENYPEASINVDEIAQRSGMNEAEKQLFKNKLAAASQNLAYADNPQAARQIYQRYTSNEDFLADQARQTGYQNNNLISDQGRVEEIVAALNKIRNSLEEGDDASRINQLLEYYRGGDGPKAKVVDESVINLAKNDVSVRQSLEQAKLPAGLTELISRARDEEAAQSIKENWSDDLRRTLEHYRTASRLISDETLRQGLNNLADREG